MDKRIEVRARNWFSPALVVALIILFINLIIIFIIIDLNLRTIIADIFYPLIDFLVAGSLFMVARSSHTGSRKNTVAWGMIGVALFSYAMGDAIWAMLEVGL